MAGRRTTRSASPQGQPDPSWGLAFDAQLTAELAAELGHHVPAPRIFSRDALRQIDQDAATLYALPTLVLMENAGRAAADAALDMVHTGDTVLIVCGAGQNGGDGLVAARHLHNAGVNVLLLLTAPPEQFRNDSAAALSVARAMKLPEVILDPASPGNTLRSIVEKHGPPGLIIDAIVGTGLSGAVREPVASLIPALNELRKSGSAILSLDLPSGLDADRGESLGQTVIADVTISFVGYKRGFMALSAQNYLGEVILADIGVPRELCERLGSLLHEHMDPEPDQPPPPAPRRGDRRSGGD